MAPIPFCPLLSFEVDLLPSAPDMDELNDLIPVCLNGKTKNVGLTIIVTSVYFFSIYFMLSTSHAMLSLTLIKLSSYQVHIHDPIFANRKLRFKAFKNLARI